MHKNELIRRVAEESGVSRQVVAEIINRALDTIADEVARGNKVVLTGFGTFEQRYRRARRGVDPRTAAEIVVPESRTPGFTASTSFKRRIQGGGAAEHELTAADATKA